MQSQSHEDIRKVFLVVIVILISVVSSLAIVSTRNSRLNHAASTSSSVGNVLIAQKTTYSATGGGLTISNGTTVLAFFESGADNGGAFVNVRNDGTQPIVVKALYLNRVPVYSNGTDRHFVLTGNPIQPGQTVTIRAVYNADTGFDPTTVHGVTFTIVTDQGVEVTYNIPLWGGPVCPANGSAPGCSYGSVTATTTIPQTT